MLELISHVKNSMDLVEDVNKTEEDEINIETLK